jgi:hypothetical protein
MDHRHMPASVFLTAKFQDHNPSKRKQSTLYTALDVKSFS